MFIFISLLRACYTTYPSHTLFNLLNVSRALYLHENVRETGRFCNIGPEGTNSEFNTTLNGNRGAFWPLPLASDVPTRIS